MTKKKRITISLTNETYDYLVSLIGYMWYVHEKSVKLTSKSQAIEQILISTMNENYD